MYSHVRTLRYSVYVHVKLVDVSSNSLNDSSYSIFPLSGISFPLFHRGIISLTYSRITVLISEAPQTK